MVSVGSVEIGLRLDKAQYYADLNTIKNSSKGLGVTIVPNVDHRPLTALNRHIDLKIRHLKELRREAQKPIVIEYKVNSQSVDEASRKVNNLKSEVKQVVVSSNIEVIHTFSPFTSEIKTVNDSIRTLISVTKAGRTKGGVLGTVGRVAKGVVTAPFKLAGSVANKVIGDISRGLLEDLGKDVGKSIKPRLKTKLKKAGVNAGDEMGDVISSALVSLIGQVSAIGSGIPVAMPDKAINTFIKDITWSLETALDPQKFKSRMGKVSDELLQAYTRYEAGQKDFLGVLQDLTKAAYNANKRQAHNALLRTLQVGSIPMNIRKEVELFRAARRIEDTQNRKIGGFTSPKYQKYSQDPNLQGKENVIFTIGGFQRQSGKSGDTLASQLTPFINPDNTLMMPVRNTFMDKRRGHKEGDWAVEIAEQFKPIIDGIDPTLFPIIEKQLRGFGSTADNVAKNLQSFVRGVNPDAERLAGINYAIQSNNPNLKAGAVGFSGGGYPVEQAVRLSEILGTPMKGAGLGVPLTGLTPSAKTGQFKGFLHQYDTLAMTHNPEWMNLSENQQKTVFKQAVKGEGETPGMAPEMAKLATEFGLFNPQATQVNIPGRRTSPGHDVQSYLSAPEVRQNLSDVIPGLNFNQFQDNQQLQDSRFNRIVEAGKMANTNPLFPETLKSDVAIAELTKFGKAIREVRTRLEELDQRLDKSLTGKNYDEIINIISGADSLVENNQRLEEQFGVKKEKKRLQNLAGQLYDETLKPSDTEKYGANEAEKLKKQFIEDWKALFDQQGWVQEGKAVLEASQSRLQEVANIIAKKEGLDPSKYTQDPKGQLAILNFLTKHMGDNPKVQRGLEFMSEGTPTTQADWEFYRPGANSRVDWDLDQYIEKGLKPMVATLPQEVKKTGEALIKYLRSIQVAMSQNIASGTPIPQEILDTSKQILTSKDVFAETIPSIDIEAKQATLKTNLEQAKGQSGLGEAELIKVAELNKRLQAQYPNNTPSFNPKDMVILGKGQNSRALLEKSTGRVVKYGIRGNQDESFINEAKASQQLGDIAYNVPKEQVPGFLISEIAEGNTVRDLLSFANSIKDVEDDIKAMGKALRKIHEMGRTHDDFHIGNLVKTAEGFKAIDLAGSEELDGTDDKAKLDRDRLRAIEHSKGILQYDILDKTGKPKINPSDFEKLFIEGYYGKKQDFSHISPSSSYLPKGYKPKDFTEENKKATKGRELPKEYKPEPVNLPVEIKTTETVKAEIVREQQGLKTAIQVTKNTLSVVNQTGQMVGKGFNDTVSALMPVIQTIYKLDQASKKVITTLDPTGLSKLGIKSAEMLMPAIGFAALTHGTPVGQLASGAVGSVVDPAMGMGGNAIAGQLTEIVSGTMGNVPLVGNQISLAANQAILEIVQGITQVLSGVGTEVVTNLLGGQVVKSGVQRALNPTNTDQLKALPESARETVEKTEKLIKGFRGVVKALKAAETTGDPQAIGIQVKAINRYLERVYEQLQEAKAATKALPGNDYKRLIGQQRGLTRQVNQQREKYPEIITIDTTAYTVPDQPSQKALPPSNNEMERLKKENEVLKKQVKSLKDVKPGQAHAIDPKQLSFNPKAFQFKDMVTDLKTGSTNSLAGITKENWNKELGGVISYWVDELGEIGDKYKAYVINGHNRVSKAIDLEIAELNAIRIEAKTAKEARGRGAIQNIIDDKGTPLDAARAFKDLGITSLKQAASYGVPKKTKTAKDAIALLQLPDWIFGQVSQGMIDLKTAINIGNERLKSNPLDNDEIKAVYDTVRKEIDKTGEVSGLFIRKYADLLRQSRQQIQTQQGGLFGDFFSQNSERIAQKASTLAFLEKNISSVARKNKSAAKDANLLEVGGNLINKEQSKETADKYKNLLEVVRQLNSTKSEVSKLINRAVDLKIEGLDEGEVNRSLTNLLASFAPLLSKGIGDFGGVADEVIAGLTQGLKDNQGRLDKTTIELAKSLPENVRRVLGIASPSKVFIEIGKNICQGLLKGLDFFGIRNKTIKESKEIVDQAQKEFSKINPNAPGFYERLQTHKALEETKKQLPLKMIPGYEEARQEAIKEQAKREREARDANRRANERVKLRADMDAIKQRSMTELQERVNAPMVRERLSGYFSRKKQQEALKQELLARQQARASQPKSIKPLREIEGEVQQVMAFESAQRQNLPIGQIPGFDAEYVKQQAIKEERQAVAFAAAQKAFVKAEKTRQQALKYTLQQRQLERNKQGSKKSPIAFLGQTYESERYNYRPNFEIIEKSVQQKQKQSANILSNLFKTIGETGKKAFKKTKTILKTSVEKIGVSIKTTFERSSKDIGKEVRQAVKGGAIELSRASVNYIPVVQGELVEPTLSKLPQLPPGGIADRKLLPPSSKPIITAPPLNDLGSGGRTITTPPPGQRDYQPGGALVHVPPKPSKSELPRNEDPWEDLERTIKSASKFSQDYLSMASPGIQNFIQGISIGIENFIKLGRYGGTALRELDSNIKAATDNTWSLGKAATVASGAFLAWRGLRFLTEPLVMGISNLPYDLYQAAKAAQEAQLNMARLEVALSFSGVNASTELSRISDKADELGVSFLKAAEGYSQLQAAALNTPIAPQVPMLSDALMTLYASRQLDPQSQEQANRAFSQIIGKQRLYAEEIQQQLNESIPGGVTGQMARAYGQTQQEFLRSVRNTGVQAEDLLPRFAVQVEMEAAAGLNSLKDSPLADFARLSNQAERLQINFGEKLLGTSVPAVKVFNASLDALNDNFDAVFVVGSSLVVMIGASLTTAIIKAATFFKTGTIAATAYSGALKLAGVDTFKMSLQTALLAEKLRIIPGVSVKASLSLASVATNGLLVMKGLAKVGSIVAPWIALGFAIDGVFKVIRAGNEELKQSLKSLKEIAKATPDDNNNDNNKPVGRRATGNAFLDFIYAPPVKTPWWQTAIPGLPLVGKFNNAVENFGRGRDVKNTNNVIGTGQEIIDNSVAGLTPEKIAEVRKGLREIRGEIELTRALQGKATKVGDVKTALEYDQELAELSQKEVDFIKENLMPLTKLQGVLDNLKKAREQLGDDPENAQQAQALDSQITQVQGKIDQVSRALQGLSPEYRKLLGTLGDVRREYLAVANSAQRATQIGNIELNTQFVAGEINPYELTEGQRRNQKQALSNQVKDSEKLAQQLKDKVYATIDSADNKTLSTQIGEDFLQGIESGELNPRVLEDLISSIANEEGRELSQNQETAIKSAIQYLEIQRDILSVREQISGLDVEQTRADQQRVQDLRGFYKTVIDFDRQLQDFQRDTERQLIDFERTVSDFNREQFRSFRGLAEQWDDLYNSIEQQTLAAINQIEDTRREIESIQLQTRFTRLNPEGFDNPLQAFTDAITAIRASFNQLQGETDKQNETRLQIETDTINIARQVRGLQEQQEDLERQRLVQLEQFRRQQQDFDQNQYRTWQDILFRSKDIETQAYQLGVSMDAVGVNVTEQGNALVMSIHELAKRINGSIESFPVGGGSGVSPLSSSGTSSQAIASGLFTGPSANIGGSSAYHIDTKIPKSVGYKKAIEMIDAVAKGYEEQDRVMEFSNSAVSGIIWDYTKSFKEKRKLLERIDKAHSHSPNPGYWDMDYYIPKKGESRHGETVRGVEMLFPKVFGSAVNYGKASNYGNWGQVRDAEGNVIWKQGHGDNRKPLPSNTTIPSITTNTPQSDGAYRGGNPTTNIGNGIPLSPQDLKLLQKIVLAEALSEGAIGQALVARSILNRSSLIKSGKTSPGTYNAQSGSLRDVIYARGQYQPVANGTIDATRTQAQMSQALAAIELAFNPSRLSSLLERQGVGLQARGNLLSATGFRTGWAFNDPSQNFNRSKYKNHVFNSDRFAQNLNVRSITDSIYGGVTTNPSQAITTTNQPVPVYQPSPVTVPEFKPVSTPSENFPGVVNFKPLPIPIQSVLQQQNQLDDLKEQQLREQQTRGISQLEFDTATQEQAINRAVTQFNDNTKQSIRQVRDLEASMEDLRNGTRLVTTAQQRTNQELRQAELQFDREIEQREDLIIQTGRQLKNLEKTREVAEVELQLLRERFDAYQERVDLTEEEQKIVARIKEDMQDIQELINDPDLEKSIQSQREIVEELEAQKELLEGIKQETLDRILLEGQLDRAVGTQRATDDLTVRQVQLEDQISGNPFGRAGILEAQLKNNEIYIQQKIREAKALGIAGEALTQYEKDLRRVGELEIEAAFVQANPFIQQFEQNLTDVLLQVRSIEDAALALFRTIASEVIKVTIARPLARMFGGVFGGMFGTGGVLGFSEGGKVGAVPNLAMGGMIQNMAEGGTAMELGMNAIAALQREKVMGGGTPVLAALTEGEYVVPKKEVPAYMSYKRQQVENRNMKEYSEVKNFNNGGFVGESPYRSSGSGTGRTYVINTSNSINLSSPNQLQESMEQLAARREEEEARIKNRFG